MNVYVIAIVYFLYASLHAVGSDTAVSREKTVTFLATGTDNVIRGFAYMEDGFSLENAATTCTFDSFFPISGQVNLNKGTFILNRDLVLANQFSVSNPGKFIGNTHSIYIGQETESFFRPSNSFLVTVVTTTATNREVNMVDWQRSYSNVCIAGKGQFTIQHFTGSGFTTVTEGGSGSNYFSVRVSRRDPIEPLAYNSGGLTPPVSGGSVRLTVNDTMITSGGFIFAGSFYSFNATILVDNTLASITYSDDNTFPPNWLLVTRFPPFSFHYYSFTAEVGNALAFTYAPAGQYYAIGTTWQMAGEGRLLINNFQIGGGLSLTLGNTVQALDWSPTGSFIAVGLHGSNDNLRIYEHKIDPASLIQKNTFLAPIRKNIATVAWSSDGQFLACGTQDDAASKIQIYAFDKNTTRLTLINDFAPVTATNVRSLRWSTDAKDPLLIVGLQDGNVTVYDLVPPEPPYQLSGTTFILNADITIGNPMVFDGTCKIDGNGRKMDFVPGGRIVVRPNANLLIQNVLINNPTTQTLTCLDDSGVIQLRNLEIALSQNYTFTRGRFSFQGDVLITGTSAFVYSSAGTSTIESQATLFLDDLVTLVYKSPNTNRNLIHMADDSSTIFCNGATFSSTSTGALLNNGKFKVKDVSRLISSNKPAEGVVFQDPLQAKILSGSRLDVRGSLVLS